MKIKRLALSTCAAMTLSAGTLGAAFADGPGFLKSADLNQDGTIEQSEFQASRDKWFQALDTNKDGFVTADELKAFGDKMHAEWAKNHPDANAQDQGGRRGRFADHILQRVDADKDGRISKAEFDAEGAAMFKRLDENGDGKIADNEMPAHHWGRFAGRMFGRMDTNSDGKVTKAEFTAAEDRMFQRMDKNGDGVIEKDEMRIRKPYGDGPDGNAPDGAPDQPPTP